MRGQFVGLVLARSGKLLDKLNLGKCEVGFLAVVKVLDVLVLTTPESALSALLLCLLLPLVDPLSQPVASLHNRIHVCLCVLVGFVGVFRILKI